MIPLSTVSVLSHAADFAAGTASAMLGMPEILGILAIVVVLFGATKLPQLGKGLGEAIGNFKKAQKDAEKATREEVDATPAIETKRPSDKLEKDDRS